MCLHKFIYIFMYTYLLIYAHKHIHKLSVLLIYCLIGTFNPRLLSIIICPKTITLFTVIYLIFICIYAYM